MGILEGCFTPFLMVFFSYSKKGQKYPKNTGLFFLLQKGAKIPKKHPPFFELAQTIV